MIRQIRESGKGKHRDRARYREGIKLWIGWRPKPGDDLPEDSIFRPGNVVDYFRSIKELKPGTKVVLVIRVSTSQQAKKRNLQDQEARLVAECQKRGLIIVYIHRYYGSSFLHGPLAHGPIDRTLQFAVDAAQDHGAVLLAESVTRFVRPHDYGKNPDAQLLRCDLEELRRVTRGIGLYTLISPDSPPEDIRSAETIRGQRGKGKHGGRPPQGHFTERWLPVANDLRADGCTYEEISHEILQKFGRSIDRTTISKGLKRLQE